MSFVAGEIDTRQCYRCTFYDSFPLSLPTLPHALQNCVVEVTENVVKGSLKSSVNASKSTKLLDLMKLYL